MPADHAPLAQPNTNKNMDETCNPTFDRSLVRTLQESTSLGLAKKLALTLPLDPDAAALTVLSAVRGQPLDASTLDELAASNKALLDARPEPIYQALARQAPLLEAVFHRFLADAMTTRQPAAKVALMKAAMQAQRSLLAVLEAMAGMQARLGPHEVTGDA